MIDSQSREDADQSSQTVVFPDAELQESLVKENAFVEEEEMPSVEEPLDDTLQQMKRRVPRGTSDYQATWIPEEDSVTDTESREESEGMHSDGSEDVDIDDFRDARSVGNGDAQPVCPVS